jgi:hypothetical protein
MILKFTKDEEKFLIIEEAKDIDNNIIPIKQDNLMNYFFDIVFCINEKINSFKDDKTGYIYTNSENNDSWNINAYNKDTKDIEFKGTVERTRQDIFLNVFAKNGFTNKLNELYIKDILDNLKTFLEKTYDKEAKEAYILLYVLNSNAIHNFKNDSIYIDIKNKVLANKLLKFNDIKKIKKLFMVPQLSAEKKVTDYIKKTFLKDVLNTDISSLKKTHSFFGGKILIDGIYIYRFIYDFFLEPVLFFNPPKSKK